MKVLTLDGVKISPSDYEGASIRKYITFDNKKAYSEEFTFTGVAFEILRDKFITSPNGRIASVVVEIRDYCCGDDRLIFKGIIKGDNYTWCDGDCYIKATVLEEDKFLDCIKDMIVSYNLPRRGHPLIATQKGYTTFERILANAVVLMSLSVIVIAGIMEVIAKALPFVKASKFGGISLIKNQLKKFNKVYFHPTPYIRDYLDNICNECGKRAGKSYDWQSDLFGKSGDYKDVVYFNANGEEAPEQKRDSLIEANLPIDTCEDWLNKIISHFNARWYIEGDNLIVNQKATQTQVQTLDLRNEKACYTPASADPAAYAVLHYSDDNDLLGNSKRALYDHIEDWNKAGNEVLRGKKEYSFQTARADIGKYDDIIQVNIYNLPDPNISDSTATGGLFLRIQNLICATPKLLALKNGVLTDNSILYGKTLYSKHFSIDNPNDTKYKAINFEVETDLDCDIEYKQGMPLLLSIGEAEAESITIDYDTRKVKFTGTV